MLTADATRSTTRRRAHPLRRIGILAGVGLVALEVGLRLVPREPATRIEVDIDLSEAVHDLVDGPLSYVPRPGASLEPYYAINEHGVRGRPFPLEKPADELRIVVLGDSVGFGVGLPEDWTFPSQLAQILAGYVPQGRTVRSINAGATGYSTAQEALFLEYRALAFDPDVIVVLLTQNDAGSPMMLEEHEGGIRGVSYPPREVPLKRAWRGTWIEGAARRSALVRASLKLALGAAAGHESDPTHDVVLVDLDNDMLTSLISIREQAQSIGAAALVTVLPRVGKTESEQVRLQRLSIDRTVAASGLAAVDLAPVFSEIPASEIRLVQDDDLHLNPLGIYLAAAATARALATEKLVPTTSTPAPVRGWLSASGAEKLPLACGLALTGPEQLAALADTVASLRARGGSQPVDLDELDPACTIRFPPDASADVGAALPGPFERAVPTTAFTKQVFLIDGGFTRFTTTPWVPGPDETEAAPKDEEDGVIFQVIADQDEVWTSRQILPSNAPSPADAVDVDVTGRDVLTLVAQPLGDHDLGRLVLWLDPQLHTDR